MDTELRTPADPVDATEDASYMRSCFFTSISSNYLAKALTLAESVFGVYPHAEFVISILNHRLLENAHRGELERHRCEFLAKGWQLGFVDPLDLYPEEHANGFPYRYNVVEACTAVKPAVALHLLERHDCVTYLDPDTLLYAPFPTDPLLGDAWDLQVTPHAICPPKDKGLLSERYFLSYGIYNLGYLGMRASAQTVDFLRWWKDFCIHFSASKTHVGLFVDQKPVDLLTCFVDRVSVVRHPGWNVGWWNLFGDGRQVSQDGTQILFNDKSHRLIFFHFSNLEKATATSGRAIASPLRSMLEHPPVDIRISAHPGIQKLFEAYERAVRAWDIASLLHAPSFNSTRDGRAIPGYARGLLGEALRLGMPLTIDPFASNPRVLALRALKFIVARLHRQDLKRAYRYLLLGAKSALTPTLLRRES